MAVLEPKPAFHLGETAWFFGADQVLRPTWLVSWEADRDFARENKLAATTTHGNVPASNHVNRPIFAQLLLFSTWGENNIP